MASTVITISYICMKCGNEIHESVFNLKTMEINCPNCNTEYRIMVNITYKHI